MIDFRAELTAQAIRAAYEYDGPVSIRTSRIGVPIIHPGDYRFEIGKAGRETGGLSGEDRPGRAR